MRGFFGIGVVNGKSPQNIGTLWRSAFCFGAAFVFTIGKRYERQSADTMQTPRHVPLLHYATVADLIEHLPYSCELVGIEIHERAKPLSEAFHPERACYLLGAEDNGLSPDVVARCHRLVKIEGASRCLNVAVAGSIVLHDRVRKLPA